MKKTVTYEKKKICFKDQNIKYLETNQKCGCGDLNNLNLNSVSIYIRNIRNKIITHIISKNIFLRYFSCYYLELSGERFHLLFK